MEEAAMIVIIRNLLRKIDESLTVSWWVIGGFTLFLCLLLAAGFIGIYSLDGASMKSQQEAMSADLARESQIEFQKQFYCWKNAVISGEGGNEFRENYHAFSQHAAKVQDLLFNLGNMVSDDAEMAGQVSELMRRHRKVTSEYIALLVRYEDTQFRNRNEILSSAAGGDAESLEMMENIAKKILKNSDEGRRDADRYYGRLVLISFTAIAVSAFVMSIIIGYKLLTMNARLEFLVKRRTEQLETACAEISISEKKYRALVEGTNDIIFSLDESLNFTTFNRALLSQLQMRESEITGKSFYSIVYISGDDRVDSREIVREKIGEFLADRKSVTFTTDFRAVLLSEPKEYTVSLEFIETEGKNEIIGRAVPASSYSLFEKLHYERKKFTIGNYLGAVDDITHHLTHNLNDRLERREIVLIRLALREILFNAIEHGNLSITFDEKTKAMMEDGYFSLIHARQNDPRYSGKRVTIEYQVNDAKITYLVTDEGAGFDHESATRKRAAANEEFVPHGRGITMAMNIFSSIRYNKKGNSVLLEKKFGDESSTG